MATGTLKYDGHLNGVKMQYITGGITAGNTVTLHVENTTRAAMFGFGFNADRSLANLVYTTGSGGTPQITPLKSSSYAEITTATNQISIKNTSATGTLFLWFITFMGDISLM